MSSYTISLGYNLYIRIYKETFIDNYHNCPPFSGVHNPYNSYASQAKGWCTTNSYQLMPVPDDYQSFEKSPVKCPGDSSRLSAEESIETDTKSFCKI